MAEGVLFSGQGAQHVGMGESLCKNNFEAASLWATADTVLGVDLQKISFSGPAESLNSTGMCQPALYVHGYVLYSVLKANGKLNDLRVALGLSLGELTALAVAGVYDYETGLRIVSRRGIAMQEACEKYPGSMASLVGGEPSQVAELVDRFDVDVSNYNSPGQIVISGEKEKVWNAMEKAKEMSFKAVVPLKVAGAYHSRLMQSAAENFENYLADINFKPPKIKVLSNVTGTFISDPEAIKEKLVQQVYSPVKWDACMKNASKALEIDTFYECGPKAVLKGLGKRINPKCHIESVSEFQELQELISA